MQVIIDYTLDKAAAEPLPTRIKLYRALAEFCADKQESASLNNLADTLQDADNACQEFAFSVKLKGQ